MIKLAFMMLATYLLTILLIEPKLGSKPKRSIHRAQENEVEKKDEEEDDQK